MKTTGDGWPLQERRISWKLQENVLEPADLQELVHFIQTTTRFTQFAKVREFEEAWSRWQSCRYSVYVNSGSSANLIMMNVMKQRGEWRNGDEVLVPAVTWTTNVTPIEQSGLTPVFVDVNLEDFSFDYDDLQRKISSRTRAVFVTHLIGFPANIARIKAAIAGKGIELLEDCCESHGAHIGGVKVGNHAPYSSFSFYWGHHITTVEGGMLCSDSEELYHLALLKRSHGLARELPPHLHETWARRHPDVDFNFLFLTDGYNFRNTEFNAVIGLAQIKKLDNYIETRNLNHHRFLEILADYRRHLILPDHPGISSFCLPFLFKKEDAKRRFEKLLGARRIEFRPIISGNLLRQPHFRRYGNPDKFPNAEFLHRNAFYIGNNQFVGPSRLKRLRPLLREAFGS
jgi:CDP-6-deoxy-D-xylo-4-hexulose-3-dehydrase